MCKRDLTELWLQGPLPPHPHPRESSVSAEETPGTCLCGSSVWAASPMARGHFRITWEQSKWQWQSLTQRLFLNSWLPINYQWTWTPTPANLRAKIYISVTPLGIHSLLHPLNSQLAHWRKVLSQWFNECKFPLQKQYFTLVAGFRWHIKWKPAKVILESPVNFP